MKIAIVTPLYYPAVGGTQASLGLISKFLAERGHEVRVYTSQLAGMDELKLTSAGKIKNFPETETKDGVLIRRLPCGGWPDLFLGLMYAAAFKLRLPFQTFLFDLRQWRVSRASDILSELKLYQPDAILAKPYTGYLARLLSRAKRVTGAKVLMHTSLHIDSPRSRYSKKAFRGLRDLDAVMTNTEYERQFLIACGLDEGRVHVTGVGIDAEEFTSSHPSGEADDRIGKMLSGKRYVLYLGRKQEGKGIEALIGAMDIVRRRFPDARLVLAGEPTDHFDARVRPLLSGKEYIHDVGRVDGADKYRLFQNAFIFSMVSNVDSFGIVYLEAWMCKKPVIGADLGATRCVIEDGRDGFLAPYGDSAALAGQISRLFEDPSLAEALGERGYEKTARLYTRRAIGEKIERLILRLW